MTPNPAIRKCGDTRRRHGWVDCRLRALSRDVQAAGSRSIVVESADIPIVGVGEATIPPIVDFLRFLGDRRTGFLVAATQATFKARHRLSRTGRRPDHHYWHPFGTFGAADQRPALPPLLASRQGRTGRDCRAIPATTVSTASTRPMTGEISSARRRRKRSRWSAGLRYAFHFDAGLVGTVSATSSRTGSACNAAGSHRDV